jgi:hypothetical protein
MAPFLILWIQLQPMQNKVFFPQAALDQWIVDGTIDLKDNELTILAEARCYMLAEGILVTKEVTGEGDPNELVGKVKSRNFLNELGGEVMEGSMIIGDNAYDCVSGWLGTPVGTFEEHLASKERATATGARSPADNPRSEEELLARFLANSP